MSIKFLLLLLILVLIPNGNCLAKTEKIAVVKMFKAPSGTLVSGLAHYGGFLWFSSYIKKPGIYKVDTATGKTEKVFYQDIVWNDRFGGLAADQFNLYHVQANNGRNAISFRSTALDQHVGFRLNCSLLNYSDLAILDGHIWAIGCNDATNPNDYWLCKFSKLGTLVKSYKVPQGKNLTQNFGLTADNKNLWISSGDKLLKVDPENGRAIDAFDIPSDRIENLAWDGRNIWGASFYGNIYLISIE